MTDNACIQAYMEDIVTHVYKRWNSLSPTQRIVEVYQCINRILMKCEVPLLRGYGKAQSTSLGQFSASSGKMYLDEGAFVSALNEAISIKDFIEMAATVYHEGRHAEQYWYIARFLAPKYRSNSYINLLNNPKSRNSPPEYDPIDDNYDLSYNAGFLAGYVGLSYQIADQAIRTPLPHKHPMLTEAKAWSDNLCSEKPFEREKKMIFHKAATLRKTNIPIGGTKTSQTETHLENLHSIETKPFTKRAYDNYYKSVLVEKDAHALEDQVVQSFNEYSQKMRIT